MRTLETPADDQWEAEYPAATPRWWFAVWVIWGAIVAATVFCFDRDPFAAFAWLVAACANAFLGHSMLRPLVISWVDYYGKQNDPDAERRMDLLIQGGTGSDEYKAIVTRKMEDAIPIAMFVGAFHGFLAGGVGGAMSNYDGYFASTSSCTMTFIGIVIGTFGFPLLYGFALVCVLPRDKTESFTLTIRRRLTLAIASAKSLGYVARHARG